MACLGSVLYDPSTAATASTASLLAMTALDTTNARITFTGPANGYVQVRIRVAQKGATSNPQILLGVLDGSTVVRRMAPMAGRQPGSAGLYVLETSFVVSVTASQSYTWDAAYGVEFAVASTQLGWGGPDDTTTNNAYGALSYEIWECDNLLAGTCYDPATAVTRNLTAATVFANLDTANLSLGFTTPASGPGSSRVAVRLCCMWSGSATAPQQPLLGVRDGTTIVIRQAPIGGWTNTGTIAATDHIVGEVFGVVPVTASTTYSAWRAAWGSETAVASSQLKWGGPDNTTQNDAFGGFAFEIWGA